MKASWKSYTLDFKFPAGTSRGVLLHKPSAYLFLEKEGNTGIGECSTIPGLSMDDESSYAYVLNKLCDFLNRSMDDRCLHWKDLTFLHQSIPELKFFPSIVFGLETALCDLVNGGKRILFESDFSSGNDSIPINGLVWMGDARFMKNQVQEKIQQGFRCIKLKIGALDFQTELKILENIRSHYDENALEIRLDANGAFSVDEAFGKLQQLSAFHVHSIEQPVKAGNWMAMADLCRVSPIPVALDEELIGLDLNRAREMLSTIKPAYIILKPSLLGGFTNSEKWIRYASENGIAWWITSALESNIGLNAIAQWTYTLQNPMPQGLGTGQLYHNNIPSPLLIENANLRYNHQNSTWDLSSIY